MKTQPLVVAAVLGFLIGCGGSTDSPAPVDNQNPPPGYNATQAYNDGRTRETRTNFLVGATVVAGVSTTVIAVFTRWGGSREGQRAQNATDRVAVSAGASPSGGSLLLNGSF